MRIMTNKFYEETISLNSEPCVKSLSAIDDALYVLGGKWKLRIIAGLSNGSIRFNDLQRMLKGISARVLSSELKELEVTGLVKRNVSPLRPAAAEYELTEYSLTLSEVLSSLTAWGQMHREKIRRRELSVQ